MTEETRTAIRGVALAIIALFGLLIASRSDHEVVSAIGVLFFLGGVGSIFAMVHKVTGSKSPGH